MVYGKLSSTWPVNTGILVHENVACFGAGIVDHDGTYVTALDAATGELKWQNTTSGHLNEALRKGVSSQGNLTTRGAHANGLMAQSIGGGGGNGGFSISLTGSGEGADVPVSVGGDGSSGGKSGSVTASNRGNISTQGNLAASNCLNPC